MSDTNNIFVAASRCQLRFETAAGLITTEDLWTLSLKALDRLAVHVASALAVGRVTFLESTDHRATKAEKENALRLEILKFVIQTKQDELKAAKVAAEKRARLEFLENLRENKRLENLASLSLEEIDAQIAAAKAE